MPDWETEETVEVVRPEYVRACVSTRAGSDPTVVLGFALDADSAPLYLSLPVRGASDLVAQIVRLLAQLAAHPIEGD